MNVYLVRGFESSWLGGISREVVREFFSWMDLVDLIFLCWLRRWPLKVTVGFLRCFDMRETVRPGQVVKCSQLMARMKFDRMKLNTVPWRNSPKLDFVRCIVMALCALFVWVIGSVVGRVIGGASGMFNRLLVWFWLPLMMIFPFFYNANVLFCGYFSVVVVAGLANGDEGSSF